MKSVFKIAIKGIFKRKTYTIAILFLTIVAAVSMVTALGTISCAQDTYGAAYKKSNSPDIFYFYSSKNYSPSYKNYFKKRKEVKNVFAQSCLIESSNLGSLNGKDLTSCVLAEYNQKENDYNLFTTKAKKALSNDEVYLPLLYKSQYNAKIGNKLIIKSGHSNKKYKVAGFFEDPTFGSSFMGNKRILFSVSGFKQVNAITINKTTVSGVLLNVYLKDKYQGAAFEKTAEAINKRFGKDTLAYFQTTKTLFASVVIIIPEIISVVLLCFSALLIIIIAIVIRHAILSSIEADYVSLGVLKAIGFTGKNIVASILLQYLIVSAIGTFTGVITGIFTIPQIGKVVMSSTGIFGSGSLTAPAAVSVIIVILAMIALISYLTARKAARISPVMAISFGKAPVHFSSRFNVALKHLHFLPLSLRMAVKQMMTKLKQYSTLIVITTIFTFTIITVLTLTNNFSSTDKMSKLLGYPLYDIDVISTNSSLCPSEKLDKIVKSINKSYGVRISDSVNEVSLRADNMSISGIIRSNFNGLKDSLVDGKLPEFDNEIAITPIMSKLLGKGIGETVEVEKDGIKKKYIITCTLQCISEMGKNICLPLSAYKRIAPDYKPMSRSIILKSNRNIDHILSLLKHKYQASTSGVTFSNEKTTFYNIFTTIKSATGLSSTIVLVLTFLLIACITVLLCTITIFRETIDTGIFKAIGFKTVDLRLQFALRFLLISIVGGIFGTLLSILFDDNLIKAMLSPIGVANLKPVWNFNSIGIPILFVVGVATLTSFLCSSRIKKISPSNLITE